MTDLQGYLTILSGFFISFTFILSGKQMLQKALVQILIWELLIKTSYYAVKIILTPVNKSLWLNEILSYKYLPDMAFMGLFLGCLACFLNRERLGRFYDLLLTKAPAIDKLLTAGICTTYLLSAIGAITNFKGWIIFFESSGYGKMFLIFIIIAEIAGGAAVLFKKTRLYAILVLTADMMGATFTHFHNYFSRHVPDPIGNALPSLAMLAVLASFMILSVHKPNSAQVG